MNIHQRFKGIQNLRQEVLRVVYIGTIYHNKGICITVHAGPVVERV